MDRSSQRPSCSPAAAPILSCAPATAPAVAFLRLARVASQSGEQTLAEGAVLLALAEIDAAADGPQRWNVVTVTWRCSASATARCCASSRL